MFKLSSASLTVAFVGITALSLTACTGGGLEGEEIATAEQRVEIVNGLGTNGLGTNGLMTNGLGTNGLGTNGLGSSGLSTTGLISNQAVIDKLSEPYVQQLLGYIIGCALTPAQQVDLTTNENQELHYVGELGLAPEWGDDKGSCDANCESWVSACIISRLNYEGVHVDISMRGNAAGLATTQSERDTYTLPEATYYGDIFNGITLYECTINGVSSLNERVCGPSMQDCIVHVTGECSDLCDQPSPNPDGYFENCRDSATAPSTTYPGSITVYRQ